MKKHNQNVTCPAAIVDITHFGANLQWVFNDFFPLSVCVWFHPDVFHTYAMKKVIFHKWKLLSGVK